MTEQDYTIQKLRRVNIALLQELHAIKACFTCSHYSEIGEHCDQYMFGNDCRDFDYEWRGVEASEDWQAEQENIRQAQARLRKMSEDEEDIFEERIGEK